MSESRPQKIARRKMLASIAAAAIAGPLTAEAAQHVHAAADDRKASGTYKPKGLSTGEFKTLEALCELIMPGAKQAGAAEFIDILSAGSKEFAALFTGGLAWMNAEMTRRYNADFVSATSEQRTALLDLIAWRKNETPALN